MRISKNIKKIMVVVISGFALITFLVTRDNPTLEIDLADSLEPPLLTQENREISDVVNIPASPPNIVIIMADDLGWNDVSYHGSEIQTPNIDKLASGAVVLDRFYTHPTCSPTRASLMTGKSPVRLGVIAPLAKINPTGLPIEEVTLADRLKEKGYQTALVGKWHLGGLNEAYLPNARGFDYFFGNLMGGIGYWDHVHGGGHDLQRNGETVRSDEYITHLTTKEANNVIKSRDKDKPLFLFTSFNAPHIPNEAPEEVVAKYSYIEDENRRIHAAMVGEFDDAVGQIYATLEAEGMLENTLIWFMSDNGGLIPGPGIINILPNWVMEIQTERILGEKIDAPENFLDFARIQLTEGASDNSPLQGGKTSLWEGAMRVPSFVYWKGVLEPAKNDKMIAVQDVLPTLMELNGVNNLGEIDGRSVWSILSRNVDLEPNPVVTISGPGEPSLAVYYYPWKLVESPEGELSLFNVVVDPIENYELSGQFPNITSELSGYLNSFPRGKVVHVPFQETANDTDFFGGEEDRAPWTESVIKDN